MASDGPDPTPCDNEVFLHGQTVFVTHSIAPNAFEAWVKSVANVSGQRVDWHFAGGRAVVLAIGDIPRVSKAITDLMPMHAELQRMKLSQIEKALT